MSSRKSNHVAYLTESQMERLLKAAKASRNGHRDYTLLLVMYRHALRVSEACDLTWSDVDMAKGRLKVNRLKHGVDSVHPIEGDELRALRQLQREQDPPSKFLFVSEQGSPITRRQVHNIVVKAGECADLPPCHPHTLRHSTGYALANKGVNTRTLGEFMGHASLDNTRIYTALNADAFKGLWRK